MLLFSHLKIRTFELETVVPEEQYEGVLYTMKFVARLD